MLREDLGFIHTTTFSFENGIFHTTKTNSLHMLVRGHVIRAC